MGLHMTIKIVRRGELPEEKIYRGTCSYCKTEFTFNGSDGKFRSDQRDGDYYEIDCPLCCRGVFASTTPVKSQISLQPMET
jgi:hypothetical protein